MPFTENNPIQVEFLDGIAGRCKTLSELIFRDDDYRKKGSTGRIFTVPIGTESDGASTKPFQSLFPSYGIYLKSAILHDFLYQTGLEKRKFVDNLFRRSMRTQEVGIFKRNVMRFAVRSWGWWTWRKRHGKKK